jgi:iron complex outermembrane receptor protein
MAGRLIHAIAVSFSVLFLIPVHGMAVEADTSVVYPMDPVIVTGTRIEVNRLNMPLSVSVVPELAIQESGESTLLPVISERVPGVFVTERGVTGFGVAEGAAGKISIRGVGGSPNTQVLVLIDGHPQFMGIFGHPLPDAYVSTDAERIEVLRGPASMLYGTGAMGGVINIITKKQHRDGLLLNARAMGGSYNTQKYSGSAGYKQRALSIFGSVNHDRTDGHRDERDDFTITNGYLKFGYHLSDHLKATIDGNLARFKTYDPGPEDSPYEGEDHWVDIERGKIALSLENDFGTVAGGLKLFRNFGDHELYDGWHSQDSNAGVLLYQGVNIFENSLLTFGSDYKHYGGEAENTVSGADFGKHSVDEFGAYAALQQTIEERLILNGGMRVDSHSEFGSEFVPQVGVSYHIGSRTTVKGSVSKGFRSPTIRELYLFPPANPDLEPEGMWNYELGLARRFLNERLNVEITGFIAEGENLIMTEGQFPNVENRNSGDFHNSGLEFEGRVSVSPRLRLAANYSYLAMDEPIVSAPEHQAFVECSYSTGILSLRGSVTHIGTLYTAVSGQRPESESYTLLGARLSVRPVTDVEIFLSGDNLTDESYEINKGYPMPGTTVSAGIHLRQIL